MILKSPESGSILSQHFVFLSETSIIRNTFWNTEGTRINLRLAGVLLTVKGLIRSNYTSSVGVINCTELVKMYGMVTVGLNFSLQKYFLKHKYGTCKGNLISSLVRITPQINSSTPQWTESGKNRMEWRGLVKIEWWVPEEINSVKVFMWEVLK